LLGGIALDPRTEPDNPTQASTFYAPPVDGLTMPWDAKTVFVNPPYGEARNPWVERCIEGRRQRVVLLIPAATETRLKVVGGATVAHTRRPLSRKAAVVADMVWCL
jgi:hypothetical protein